jgi:hypothetical protein
MLVFIAFLDLALVVVDAFAVFLGEQQHVSVVLDAVEGLLAVLVA